MARALGPYAIIGSHMSLSRRVLLPPAAVLLCALALAACGGGEGSPATSTETPGAAPTTPTAAAPPPATTPAPATPAPAPTPPPTTPPEPAPAPDPAARPPAPQCPPDAGNCQAASGRVISLESVDADGDGDLHLILASRQGVTLPGVTVLDVGKDLRPAHDPQVGDWAAGAGPVYRGSYGQRQIQVDQVVYAPTR